MDQTPKKLYVEHYGNSIIGTLLSIELEWHSFYDSICAIDKIHLSFKLCQRRKQNMYFTYFMEITKMPFLFVLVDCN